MKSQPNNIIPQNWKTKIDKLRSEMTVTGPQTEYIIDNSWFVVQTLVKVLQASTITSVTSRLAWFVIACAILSPIRIGVVFWIQIKGRLQQGLVSFTSWCVQWCLFEWSVSARNIYSIKSLSHECMSKA